MHPLPPGMEEVRGSAEAVEARVAYTGGFA